MLRGIYTATSGMLTQQRVQEMTSNNMANLNTTGHKRDMSVQSDFPSMLINRVNDTDSAGPGGPEIDMRPYIGELGTGTMIEETVKDFSQGSLKETDNALDLALEGEGFFTVEGIDGEEYYTRNGALTLAHGEETDEAFLSTLQGHPVMGQEGVIQLSGDEEVSITESGAIYEGTGDDQEFVDNLALVNFENAQGLSRQGENLLEETEESGAPIDLDLEEDDAGELTVHQGMVETSNVNTVD